MAGKRRAAWLEEKIDLSQRAARNAECPRCGAPTLRGRSAEIMYWDAVVDAMPVDQHDEAAAYAEGRMSYDLIIRHGERQLDVRSLEHVQMARRWPVHVDHACTPGVHTVTTRPTNAPVEPEGLF